MLVSAMRTNESIEMRVIDGPSRDAYQPRIDIDKQTNSNSLLNSNNNNNNTITSTSIHSQRQTAVSGDDLSDINSCISPFDSLNQQKIATSYPNLPGQFRQFDSVANRSLSGSVPALATGRNEYFIFILFLSSFFFCFRNYCFSKCFSSRKIYVNVIRK